MATGKAMTRLIKELKSIHMEHDTEVILQVVDDANLFDWTAHIRGPPDTPYQGAYFQLAVHVPVSYPLEPPQVLFSTKVFHPNIHFKSGEICLDILKDSWTPSYTLSSVCRSIINLLEHPNPESPLNCDCGNLLRCGDIRGYQSMARMYTRIYANFNGNFMDEE
eukprot:TRINITY_DN2420_c0_g1_i2.p1 TRINITY_DN2420_c0_g1~~TRINITY_DN2420_c0_g1_i2.p1  ORF type:complete len:164 (-),score=17.64 TRINITY_DN2420_c0_g1_i2:37-528(-)